MTQALLASPSPAPAADTAADTTADTAADTTADTAEPQITKGYEAKEDVALKHGAGGRAMRRLIEEVFVPGFADTPAADRENGAVDLTDLDDGAVIPLAGRVAERPFLVFTTDSHVVHPIFFPGGDIGRLAVCGTVNDLAVMGATEILGLTCAVIVEEGFPRRDLERIQASIRAACAEAGTRVLTGDTKVMGRGELDGIVLNTSGVGLASRPVADRGLRPGDRIVVSGNVGDHGLAILAAREGLELEGDLRSDVAPVHELVRLALDAAGDSLVAMKDPTRGGLASTLHELVAKSGVGIVVDETSVPRSAEVRAASELLGIDPLIVANEGKVVFGVRREEAGRLLDALHGHPLGRDAAVIGTCTEEWKGQVVLDTGFGRRLLAEAEGEPLPRIC